MKKMTLEEIKEAEFEILCSFDAACKKHGLRYCLAYGTCLGAIRHKGFIPWDDDIDVHMPREDYEEFFRLFTDGKIDWKYNLVFSRNGSSYHPTYKITNPSTICHEAYVNKRYSIGLWIDVFPLDTIDLSSSKAKNALNNALAANKKMRRMLAFAVGDPSEGSTLFARLIKKAASPFSRRLDPFDISRELERNSHSLDSFPHLSSDKDDLALVDISESTGDTIYCFPYNTVFPLAFATFEGRNFPVPGKTDDYLKLCYGNWEEIPSEDERHPHFSEAYAL